MSNRALPMMPWYPDQFAASTVTWTWLERAIYRALLDVQWAIDVLPNDEASLARACHVPLQRFRKAWKVVKCKFPPVEGGGLQNYRLEQHRLASIQLKEARAYSGRLGGLAKAAKLQQTSSTASSEATVLSVAKPYPPSPSPSPSPSKTPQPPKGGPAGLNGKRRERGPERARKDLSKAAHSRACDLTAEVRKTNLTWTYVVEQSVDDPSIKRAIEALGEGDFDHGCRLIADRDRFTSGDIESRFREHYEHLLEASEVAREGKPAEASQ